MTGRETALVALEVLFLERGTEPHPVPGVADLIERLAAAAPPTILVGETVAGRRLPLAWPKRVAWIRAATGLRDGHFVAYDEPDTDRLAGAGVATATHVEHWRGLGARYRARWVITDRDEAAGHARAAGLTAILVGPSGTRRPDSIVRASYAARDLRDAVNHVLLGETFGSSGPTAS